MPSSERSLPNTTRDRSVGYVTNSQATSSVTDADTTGKRRRVHALDFHRRIYVKGHEEMGLPSPPTRMLTAHLRLAS